MVYCYACDWVINSTEFDQVWRLIEIAKLLQCELKDSPYEFGLESKEGYVICRFALGINSKDTSEKFFQRIADLNTLNKWFEISEEYFYRLSIVNGINIPSLIQGDVRSWAEGLSLLGWRNKRLEERLTFEKPAYYLCNWLIPELEPNGWLEKAVWSPDLNYTLRIGKTSQTSAGFFIQEMVLRIFPHDDLEGFVRRVGNSVNLNVWTPILETEFLNASPITILFGKVASQGLYNEAEDLEAKFYNLGLANAELKQRFKNSKIDDDNN